MPMLARRPNEDSRSPGEAQAVPAALLDLIDTLASGDEAALRRAVLLMAAWTGVCSVTIEVRTEHAARPPIRAQAGTFSSTYEPAASLRLDLLDRGAIIGVLVVTFDDSEFIGLEVPRRCETAAVLISGVAARCRLEAMFLDAQSYEGVGRIAAGLVHDFNNMLTGIMGSTAVVRELLAPADRATAPVARIEEATTSAAHLARALLSFVRGSMERSSIDLNELVTTTHHVLERAIRDDVSISLDLAPGLARVPGEQPLLQQALINLVMNAAEAVDDEGHVVIRTREAEAPTDVAVGGGRATGYVVLSVADDGPGIPPEVLPEVFRPFFSTKGSLGTGLGLALVAQVARRHGGSVEVESQPGEGATFSITLPAEPR